MFSTMKGEPCAPKAQVGALFSEFLSLSEPCSDLLLSDSSDTIITSTPSSPLPLMLSVQGPSSRTTATDMRSDQSKPPPKRKVGGFLDTGLKKKRVKKDDAVVEQACADVDASKKARRRKQNRVAAQTSREKKKKYLTNLEDKVHALTQQNQDLQAQLQAMQEENMRLKQAQAMEFSCAKTEDVIQGVDPIITDVVVKTESVESCFSTDPEQTWQQSATTCETAVGSGSPFLFGLPLGSSCNDPADGPEGPADFLLPPRPSFSDPISCQVTCEDTYDMPLMCSAHAPPIVFPVAGHCA